MKHLPKHRAPKAASLPEAVGSAFEMPARTVRRAVLFSGVAVAATGVAVSGGMVGAQPGQISATEGVSATSTSVASSAQLSVATVDQATAAVVDGVDFADLPDLSGAAEVAGAADRAPVVSRSDRRDAADPLKQAALSDEVGEAMTATESLSDSDPRDIARALMPEFGFSSDQFGCLDSLYTRESGWNPTADNPTSSAYGISQSLPGSKMASAGADWATNPVTQITWGLGYIQDVYGSPCGAWAASESKGWY